MFTLEQSRINLCKRILDSYEKVIPDNWNACYRHNELNISDGDKRVLFIRNGNELFVGKKYIDELIRLFDIPDFHFDMFITVKPSKRTDTYKYLMKKVVINTGDDVEYLDLTACNDKFMRYLPTRLYLRMLAYPSLDFDETRRRISMYPERKDQIIASSKLKAVRFYEDDIDALNNLQCLFEQKPHLHVWIGDTHYTSSSIEQMDFVLFVAKSLCRDPNNYCVTNTKPGKYH